MTRKTWIVLVTVGLAAALARPAYAEYDTGRQAITKLFRGVTNTATGWLEIPKQIAKTSQESGAGPGFTWGFAKGIGWAIGRTVVGAYEIVTFPFPIPEEYRPVMQPEYVLSDLPENPQPR